MPLFLIHHFLPIQIFIAMSQTSGFIRTRGSVRLDTCSLPERISDLYTRILKEIKSGEEKTGNESNFRLFNAPKQSKELNVIDINRK